MSEKKILARSKPTKIVFLFCWLFIFVLPAFIFQLCLDWLFDLTLQSNYRAINREMINEMTLFTEQVTTAAFLQRKLENICKNNKSLILNVNAKKWREKLESELGFAVALCVSHGPDIEETDFDSSAEFSRFIRVLPKKMNQRVLMVLNQQLPHNSLSSREDSVSEISRIESERFFKQQFSLITEIPLIPNRVIKSISGKLRGIVYFYYYPVLENSRTGTKAVGGTLLMVIGRNINYRKVLEGSLSSENHDLQRSFSRLPFDLPRRHFNENSIASGFKVAENEYYLETMLPQSVVVDLIQRGTFFPGRINEIAHRVPMLKVGVAKEKLQHKLFCYRNLIAILIKIFVLTGAVCLLNFALFGIAFNSGIRQKALAGIFMMLLLPVALLSVSIITWAQFTHVENRYLQENWLANQIDMVQQRFSTFLNLQQLNTIKLAREIDTNEILHDREKLERRFDRFLKETPASLVLFDRIKEGSVIRKNYEPKGNEKAEEDLLKGTSRAFINTFDDQGNFDFEYVEGVNNNFTAVNPAFINDMLSSYGRLFEYGRYQTGNRFSFFPLLFPGKAAATGTILARYSEEDLINAFVATMEDDLKSEAKGVALYRYSQTAGKIDIFQCPFNQKVSAAQILPLLEGSVVGDSQQTFRRDGKLLMLRRLVDFPLIIAGQVSEKVPIGMENSAAVVALLCVLLLLIFAYLAFGLIYLEPLNEFIRITRCVAAGDRNSLPAIVQGDEFYRLKQAFDSMIHGIAEKEQMSQFVSGDVLEAVQSQAETGMQPGGERIEATVVFVKAFGLEFIEDPHELMHRLGFFIECAEQSMEKWGGVIDKVLEDTLMLVFRHGNNAANHAEAGCRVLLSMSETLASAHMKFAAGIATGEVISGRIGSRIGKLDYTVIGDTVNLAARLKAEAGKAENSRIIIAPSTIRKLKGRAGVEFIERIPIKGKSREYPLYELIKIR